MAIKDGDTVVLKDGSKGFVLFSSAKSKKVITSLEKRTKKYPLFDKAVNAVIVPFADIVKII